MKLIFVSLLLQGCALAPDIVRPEIEHMSHVTQHPPFTATNGHIGATMAGVTLQWHVNKVQIEVNESVNLSAGSLVGWGEIEGPREEFSARVGYNFEIR